MKVIYKDTTGRGALWLPWGFDGFELEPDVETELPDELVLGCEQEVETIDGIEYVTRAARLPLTVQHPDVELVGARAAKRKPTED
jgi:hypothetical protein